MEEQHEIWGWSLGTAALFYLIMEYDAMLSVFIGTIVFIAFARGQKLGQDV